MLWTNDELTNPGRTPLAEFLAQVELRIQKEGLAVKLFRVRLPNNKYKKYVPSVLQDQQNPSTGNKAMRVFEHGNEMEISDTVNAEQVQDALWAGRLTRPSFVSGIPESVQDQLLENDYFKNRGQIDMRDLLEPGKSEEVIRKLEESLKSDTGIVLHHFTEGQNERKASEDGPVGQAFRILRSYSSRNINVCVLSADFVDLRLFPRSFESSHSMPFNNYLHYFLFNGSKVVSVSDPSPDSSLVQIAEEDYQERINQLEPGEEITLSLTDLNAPRSGGMTLRSRYRMLSNTPGLEYQGNGVWRKQKPNGDTAMSVENNAMSGLTLSHRALAQTLDGGIDLSQQDSAMHITKDANGGVKVTVDKAFMAQVEREGLRRAVPVIIYTQLADMKSLYPAAISVSMP
ncbi:MAG: hypothetical protein HQL13_04570 [Candidatus Omnitrophica bacterium]|nr:hypothetical protein [Candidatus Omnitrophota bacterium]